MPTQERDYQILMDENADKLRTKVVELLNNEEGWDIEGPAFVRYCETYPYSLRRESSTRKKIDGYYCQTMVKGASEFPTTDTKKKHTLPGRIRNILADDDSRFDNIDILYHLRHQWPEYGRKKYLSALVGNAMSRFRKKPPFWFRAERDTNGKWVYWSIEKGTP